MLPGLDRMRGIFRLTESLEQEGGEKRGAFIGLDVSIAGKETSCPVSKTCYSCEELTREAKLIQDNLEQILEEAKAFFGKTFAKPDFRIGPDMSAEEIWSILSQTEDEDLLVEHFNGLDDATRSAVAEHVLTKCNIFSGMAAVFSARYDNESRYME